MFVRRRIPGLLLFFKVGSGKTLASIAAAENLIIVSRQARRVLVVTPASLQDNYKKELNAAQVDTDRYTVMSFDKVHALYKNDRPELHRLANGAILIIDEAQNLRNVKSKRLESIAYASEIAYKRLLLSGTPVMNYPQEIAPLLMLLNPALRNTVAGNVFRRTFGRNATYRVRELDDLLRCTTMFYEPDAATMARDYPAMTEHRVTVPMDASQTKAQFRVAENLPAFDMEDLERENADDENKSRHVMKYLSGPRTIANKFGTHMPKLHEVANRVAAAFEDNKKCLVYSSFLKDGIYAIRKLLTHRGVPSTLYEGKMTAREKTDAVTSFNAGVARVLLISDAGGEGLDLKNTSQVHLVEAQWNADKLAQVIGRAVRYKSHTFGRRHVDIYTYIATLPQDLARESQLYGWTGLLFKMSADQILDQLARNKHIATQTFLDRLIRISRDNLVRCV
jgi:SNF2 family DNA or RNA helicase